MITAGISPGRWFNLPKSQVKVWEVQRKHKARDARVSLRVLRQLREGPVCKLGKVVLLPQACGAGLQLLQLLVGSWVWLLGFFCFVFPCTLSTCWVNYSTR